MKIVICGSMSSSEKMVNINSQLKELGHEVLLPKHAKEYARGDRKMEDGEESTENKIKNDLIRDYYDEINNGDAVLIVNENKKGIENYIGGNVFLEMGFAHVLNKKIFLLNSIPEIGYKDEIIAMQPVVLDGDIRKISNSPNF
jgi:predicted RNA-binding protein with PUA domain